MPLMSVNKKTAVLSNVYHTEKIFNEHGDFIRSIISFNVKNKSLCEDIYQDLFLHFTLRPIPVEVQSERAFIYRVTCDKIKDSFRKIDSYQKRVNRYARFQSSVVENRPEENIAEVEETEKMFSLIQESLPQNEALAVTLRYRDNYGVEETARKMGVKPRSVSRYVSVGLKKMRDVFVTNEGGLS